MESLKQWTSREDIKALRALPPAEYRLRGFPRDPMRPIHYTDEGMLSPADGFLLCSKVIQPGQNVINCKGAEFTLENFLGMKDEKILVPCLHISILLTIFDVHWTRMPMTGYMSWRRLEAVIPQMDTMIPVEEALLDELELKDEYFKYNVRNERKVYKIYAPEIQQSYYIVLVADVEVEAILNRFSGDDKQLLIQGDRFAHITHGSEADLIIPMMQKSRYNFESLVDGCEKMHVEAGSDKLVRIKKK